MSNEAIVVRDPTTIVDKLRASPFRKREDVNAKPGIVIKSWKSERERLEVGAAAVEA